MPTTDPIAIQLLAALGDRGSLTAAAAHLGISQPTAGRRLRALEDAVGAPLVARHGRGVALTEAADELLDAAREVARALERFELLARAHGRAIGGLVRVSASGPVASELLPEWVAALRAQHPGIQVAIVAENRVSDVVRREVDLAVRMFRPTEADVVAVRLGESPMALYASADYVARRGAPRTLSDVHADKHDVVAFDRDAMFDRAFRAVVGDLPAERVALRTDAHAPSIAALRAGVGIGAVQRVIAARYPDLVRVAEDVAVPSLDVWLVTHRDLRRSRLVRAAYDSLRAWLGERLSAA